MSGLGFWVSRRAVTVDTRWKTRPRHTQGCVWGLWGADCHVNAHVCIFAGARCPFAPGCELSQATTLGFGAARLNIPTMGFEIR